MYWQRSNIMDEQHEPDLNEPSPKRQAELEGVFGRQKGSGAPYKEVEIRTLGELAWIMQQRNWSGESYMLSGTQRANLIRARFTQVDLSRAQLQEANLSRADLSQAILSGANLKGVNLTGAALFRANLSGADL